MGHSRTTAPRSTFRLTGIPALVNGTNVLAVGVWGNQPTVPPSSDLVLVPKLAINRTTPQEVKYLANGTDPGLGETWIDPLFDDSSWTSGFFGIGYETGSQGARFLLQTTVPSNTYSVVRENDVQCTRSGLGQPCVPRRRL